VEGVRQVGLTGSAREGKSKMGFWNAMVGMIFEGATVVEVKEDKTSRTVITRDNQGRKAEYTQARPAKSGGSGSISEGRDRNWWEIFS